MPSILYIIVHQSHWLLIAAKERRLIEVLNVEEIPSATFPFKQGDNLPEESQRATEISCWGTSVVGRKIKCIIDKFAKYFISRKYPFASYKSGKTSRGGRLVSSP